MAITVMGFKTVKNMVVALSSKSMYSTTNSTEKFMWEHSMSTALADKFLASNVGLGDSEDMFITGLLHDVGKVLLMDQNPDTYGRLLPDYIKDGEPTIGLEKEQFGFTHAEVGAALCRSWNLPEEIEGGIKFHHSRALDRLTELEPDTGKLSAVAALANSLSNKIHFGAKMSFENFKSMSEPACEVLRVTREQLCEYVRQIRELFEQERALFAV